ncbi:hypothetical protein H6F61_01260 [Cyanobacteria bacterium FACHB-472]|nr:hypothetical protein [Cyanobacteria bacterium FACHB-472]
MLRPIYTHSGDRFAYSKASLTEGRYIIAKRDTPFVVVTADTDSRISIRLLSAVQAGKTEVVRRDRIQLAKAQPICYLISIYLKQQNFSFFIKI